MSKPQQFHNYEAILSNSDRFDNLAELFFQFVHKYREVNNGDRPTHLVVSPATRLDLYTAFRDPDYSWLRPTLDDNETEKLNGMVVSIVSGPTKYLEVV